MRDHRRLVVFSGGPSAEREVSLRSGSAVANALRNCGHVVTEIDPQPGTWELPLGTEAVFLALHGTYGEDGTVQEELERRNIPYTGCGIEASRTAFDKILAKQRFIASGVPTAPFAVLGSPTAPWPGNAWHLPVVLKPARQGSSVGLQFVHRMENFQDSVAECLRFDRQVLMEELIVGRETTVGILGDVILPVVEVVPRQGAYDYTNKYTPGRTEYFCPADFPPEVTSKIQQAAWAAFQSVGGRDYARVDVMVRPDGQPMVLEVNTLPGMTETSLLPKAAAAIGLSFEDLCGRMIDLALSRSPGNGGFR